MFDSLAACEGPKRPVRIGGALTWANPNPFFSRQVTLFARTRHCATNHFTLASLGPPLLEQRRLPGIGSDRAASLEQRRQARIRAMSARFHA